MMDKLSPACICASILTSFFQKSFGGFLSCYWPAFHGFWSIYRFSYSFLLHIPYTTEWEELFFSPSYISSEGRVKRNSLSHPLATDSSDRLGHDNNSVLEFK
jgi:hypothetical protein